MTPKILVFDSGVGGLSVLTELRRVVPQCQLVFACDNAAFPYGTKSERELEERVDNVLKRLIQHTAPDIVVVACNSASTLVLPRIRSHFDKPVVGVVPAIKPAGAISKSRCIGLLATPGTVQRQYTQQLIDNYAGDCRVIAVGSSELVHMAEQKLQGEPVCSQRLKQILAPLLSEHTLDTVVLACTHFPLLRDELEALGRPGIHWVDSGEAIARRVHSLLPPLSDDLPHQPESLALFTEAHPQQQALAIGLSRFGCVEVDVLAI